MLALVLGAVAFAALGIGADRRSIRSPEGSSAVVNAIFLPMAFLSGLVLLAAPLPRVPARDRRRAAAEVLPRLVNATSICTATQIWAQPAAIVAVLAAWGIGGLVVAVR